MDEKFYELLEKVYVELLSTKEDLKDLELRMATKEDLKDLELRMATKEDLKDLELRMATKEDLKDLELRMVTKEDLKDLELRMVKKEDLELAIEELKAETQIIYDELKEFRQDFNILEIQTNKNALDISRMKLAR